MEKLVSPEQRDTANTTTKKKKSKRVADLSAEELEYERERKRVWNGITRKEGA